VTIVVIAKRLGPATAMSHINTVVFVQARYNGIAHAQSGSMSSKSPRSLCKTLACF
jgi:hypothetical protein